MEDLWTISELAQEAAARLAGAGLAQESGRVRDTPNTRLIRWYTTIGLLDPPIRNGRRALYGLRHLMQLVAVKRRQAEGRPLAEIQAELAGATDAKIQKIAGLPEGSVSRPAGSRARFWTDRPVRPAPPAPPLVHGVRLAPGVTLLLDAPEAVDCDLSAVAAAARPLLAELARRGLITGDPVNDGPIDEGDD